MDGYLNCTRSKRNKYQRTCTAEAIVVRHHGWPIPRSPFAGICGRNDVLSQFKMREAFSLQHPLIGQSSESVCEMERPSPMIGAAATHRSCPGHIGAGATLGLIVPGGSSGRSAQGHSGGTGITILWLST